MVLRRGKAEDFNPKVQELLSYAAGRLKCNIYSCITLVWYHCTQQKGLK